MKISSFHCFTIFVFVGQVGTIYFDIGFKLGKLWNEMFVCAVYKFLALITANACNGFMSFCWYVLCTLKFLFAFFMGERVLLLL